MSKQELEELKTKLQKRNFYTTNDASWVFFWCLILPFVLGLAFMYATMSITGVKDGTELFNSYLWFAIIMTMLTEVVFFVVYLFYSKTYRIKLSSCGLSFKKANPKMAFLSVGLGILAFFGFVGLIEGVFGNFFSWIGVKSSGLRIPNDTVVWLFINILLVGFLPAICEEIIFRGMIFKGLRRTFSPFAASAITALLFALMHQNIIQFIYPFVLGFALCLVMEKTNNLLYTMLIHLFNNITTIVVDFLMKKGVINISFAGMPWWAYIVSVVIAAVVILFFVWLYKAFISKQERVETKEEGEEIPSYSKKIGGLPLVFYFSVAIAIAIIVVNLI